MTTNNADRERAQRLLRHYFRMIVDLWRRRAASG